MPGPKDYFWVIAVQYAPCVNATAGKFTILGLGNIIIFMKRKIF